MGNCVLCGSSNRTLAHISIMCTVELNQERYTWRQSSFQINGTTFPRDIIVFIGNGSKPYLVILDLERKTIALLELTCSLPVSASKAHTLKDTRNTKLAKDLEEKG